MDTFKKQTASKKSEDALEETTESFYRLAYLFRVNYITNYIMSIKTNAIDLYDRETLEDHAHRKLIIIAGNIERTIANFIGYEDFINKDLLYLDMTCNLDAVLYKIVSRDVILKIQQDLRDRRDRIGTIDNPTEQVLELQKLYDKVQMHEILFMLVEQYAKEDVTKKLETTLNNNIDFYKERHELYVQIDALIVEIEQLISKYDTNIQSQAKIDEYKKRRPKSPSTNIPANQVIDLDLMKFFSKEYKLNQLTSIDDNAHKKDIDKKAYLFFDEETLEDVRFRDMIIKDGETGKIQLYPIHYALLNSFIELRNANAQDSNGNINIDKAVKLQDVLRYMADDMSYRLPTSKKALQKYEDMMLFAKKCIGYFVFIDQVTKQELCRTKDPIPLLENYLVYSESKREYEYIIGNSIITAFITKKRELEGTQQDTKANLTSKSLKKLLFKDGQRNDLVILNAKYHIYTKVMQMINAVNSNKPTNSIINIEIIYKYYANYREHPAPTKDDKKEARECINKFLDHLISKGLVKSYEQIKDKKTGEILQYKINVYSKRDLRENTKKLLNS